MNIKSPLEKRVVYTRAYTIIQNWRECEKRLDQEKIGYTKYIKYSINNLLVDRFYSGPEPLAIVLINNINYIRQVCTTPDTTYFFSLRDNKLFSHADVKKRVHSSCTNPNCPKKILGFEPQS